MNITTSTPLMASPALQMPGVAPQANQEAPSMAPVGAALGSTPQPAPATQTGSDGDASGGRGGSLGSEQLRSEIERANEKLRGGGNVEFAVHEGSNRVVVRLVDPKSMEIIREFPNSELLDMVAKLQELSGLNVDLKR
ncbi:MAG: flagellar protein FlaG [Candidatus Sericytochromatia bacterium]|nr:flagellar protein FlaG [Candidatus Sericytochromatia bacterium]